MKKVTMRADGKLNESLEVKECDIYLKALRHH